MFETCKLQAGELANSDFYDASGGYLSKSWGVFSAKKHLEELEKHKIIININIKLNLIFIIYKWMTKNNII